MKGGHRAEEAGADLDYLLIVKIVGNAKLFQFGFVIIGIVRQYAVLDGVPGRLFSGFEESIFIAGKLEFDLGKELYEKNVG